MRFLLYTLLLFIGGSSLHAQASLIKDIRSGTGSSSPGQFTLFDGKFFFQAGSDSLGTELFVTDGTTEGTQLFKDLVEGSASGRPQNFFAFNNKLYFAADTDSLGTELWVSDGTSEGTRMLADINPGPIGSAPANFIEYNGRLYFTAADTLVPGGFRPAPDTELYRLSEDEQSAELFKEIGIGDTIGNPRNFIIVDGLLYFSGVAGVTIHPVFGPRPFSGLWVSDGSAEGTRLITEQQETVTNPSEMVDFNGVLFFQGATELGGDELFAYAGDSVRLVVDPRLEPGLGSRPAGMTVLGDKLFYNASSDSLGVELYMTDGTAAGTRLLDIHLGPGIGSNLNGDSRPRDLQVVTEIDGKEVLYFVARDSVIRDQLFRLTLDEQGEPEISSFLDLYGVSLSAVNDITSTGSTLYFEADTDEFGTELYKFSLIGDTAPERVTDVNPGSANASPANLSLLDNTLLFTARGALGTELYGLPADRGAFEISVVGEGEVNNGDTLDLGTIFIGEASDEEVIVLNTGSGRNAATVLNQAALGASFSVVPGPGLGSIAEGRFGSISLNVAPGEEGLMMDSLVLSVFGADGPETVKLYLLADARRRTGELTATAAGTPLTGTEEINFGDVVAWQDSTITVTFENTGNGPLQFLPALVEGTKFSADDLSAGTLLPGESDAIAITFSPQSVTTYTDTLVLTLFLNEVTTTELVIPLIGNALINSINNFGIAAVRAYPNPTTDQLRVELQAGLKDGTARVFDAVGRLVLQSAWPQNAVQHTFSLATLPAGSYTVEVASVQGRLLLEVIKH